MQREKPPEWREKQKGSRGIRRGQRYRLVFQFPIREPLWAVTDETMRNWLKQAVRRAEADGVHFSIPVTPHTFRHSYIMHMLYHRQPRKVIQALAGHRDPRSMEVYTRVFALDMAATLAVPFTGDGRDAAEILRTLPPLR